jgi:hypothetical protein
MGRFDRLSKGNSNIRRSQSKTKPSAGHSIPDLDPHRYHDEYRRTFGRSAFQPEFLEKTRKARIRPYPVALY